MSNGHVKMDMRFINDPNADDMSTLDAALNLRNGFDSYGFFVKPSDFNPTLPCNVWRDINGNLYNDMSFSQYTSGATAIYVNATTGNDSTGTGASGTPYQTLLKAFNTATAGAATSYNIIVQGDTTFYRNQGFPDNGGTVSGKTIAITPDDPSHRIRITTHQNALSWTNQGGGVWSASRTNTCGVYDLRQVDSNNVPVPLSNQPSLSSCQAVPNSWYTDGTLVYVHSKDGLQPTDTNFIISVNLTENEVTLNSTSTLYLQNVDFIQGRDSHACIINGDTATSSGVFVANNCRFIGGIARPVSSATDGNAYAGNNLKNTYLFNCIAAYSGRDGFNHHFSGVTNDTTRRNYFVMEFNCLSYNNGLLDQVNGNNNAFTGHDGVNILRFGCIGYNTTGPVMADVNSCYSLNVYCNMHDSEWGGGTGVCYYFDQQTPPTGVTGKVILLNCSVDGDTKSAYHANYMDSIPVYHYGNSPKTIAPASNQPVRMV